MPHASSLNRIRFVLVVSVFIAATVSILPTTTFQPGSAPAGSTRQDDGDPFFLLAPSSNVSHVNPRTGNSTLVVNTTASQFCQSFECWKYLAQSLGLVRAFPDRHDQQWLVQGKSSEPLINHETNRTYSDAGILYVKNFKAASSTAAGVALRLAYRLPTTVNNETSSNGWVRFHHTPGWTYRNRNPARSFLFTSIRDPARRALSRIFYTQISQHGRDAHNDDLMLNFLRDTDSQYGSVRHTGGGYQVWYTSMEGDRLPRSWGGKRPTTVQNRPAIQEAVRGILNDYDFILVAERLDESIVTMALLMNVSLDDVLVQNAKESSASAWYYFKRGNFEQCRRPVPVFQSPAVRHHLQSEEWIAKNYGDYLLLAASHLSLDATMGRLGQERVNRALQFYRGLQEEVGLACRNETVYHCSFDGKPQRSLSKIDCYSDDSGCGYPCIDSFLSLLPESKTARVF